MHPIKQKLKSITSELKDTGSSNLLTRNCLKEYLQDIVLYVIYSDSKFKKLIFYGGTCLRKIYGMNRLSEDLDFETPEKIDLDFLKETLINYFKQQKFEAPQAAIQKSENIRRVTLKFPVLFDLGLSPHPTENLHVKVEINEKITGKYATELTPYTKDRYSMLLKHYDLPTLMAGKIVACLERVFKKGETGIEIKGRDFYDLVWFMQKGIEPNPQKLIDTNPEYRLPGVFSKLDEKVAAIKTKDLLVDLEPLFEDHAFIKDWCQNFHQIYRTVSKTRATKPLSKA